jgi:hypothetical protein
MPAMRKAGLKDSKKKGRRISRRPSMFAGGTWYGDGREERSPPPSWLIVVGAFAVFGEIKPFTLTIRIGAKPNRLVECEEERE